MLYDKIVLEPEQKMLLCLLVEAARSVPKDQRRRFTLLDVNGGTFIQHLGLPNHSTTVYISDIEILNRNGLINISRTNSRLTSFFDVMPEGFQYYKEMKLDGEGPIQREQSSVRNYLTADSFQQDYSVAYQKWYAAEESLWSTDSDRELTIIGHLCREAMQEFIDILINKHQPIIIDPDKAHHIARLKAIITHKSNELGKTIVPFLEALISYWGTVSDLVQRQEHAGQKEGTPIVWEDARRVVFHTIVVMYEIDRALSHAQKS